MLSRAVAKTYVSLKWTAATLESTNVSDYWPLTDTPRFANSTFLLRKPLLNDLVKMNVSKNQSCQFVKQQLMELRCTHVSLLASCRPFPNYVVLLGLARVVCSTFQVLNSVGHQSSCVFVKPQLMQFLKNLNF